MATTPTNKPIPSEEPRDLKFNSGKVDEFVTSPQDFYEDRFGQQRLTTEGIRRQSIQAMSAYGYITIDSFEDGATLTLPNQVLRYESTGEYYRWNGGFPKVVAPASTPSGSGGIGSNAWVSVGDASLRSDLARNSATSGDSLIAARFDGAPSVGRTIHDWYQDEVDVRKFGARGDGSSDDTSAIQAAIDWTCTRGKSVKIPDGVFMVEQLVIKPHTRLFGNGRSSVIKRRSDNNLDLIYGVNSNAMWGSTDTNATNFTYDVEIHDLYLDGGVDGVDLPFSSSRNGSGIAIFGHNNRFYNLDILNCAEHGIRTEGHDNNIDFGTVWQETSFYSIRIRNCGAHGWVFDGPHDSKGVDISIINASQRGDNLYDGMITGKQGTGDFSGLHISVSGNRTNNFESLRHRYSLNLRTPCRFSGGTSIEGARIPLRIAGSGSQFDSSCTYYAAWGDGFNCITILLDGVCTLNSIKGKIVGSEQFRPGLQYGIQLAYASGTSINNNDIDVTVDGCNIPISFGSSTTTPDGDKGNNTIKIKAYYGGTQSPRGSYGVPNTSNGTQVKFEITGTSYQYYDTTRQTFSTAIAAGSQVSWTFPFKFKGSPVITTSVLFPGSTPTGSVWINELDSSHAKFVNGTGQAITLHSIAVSV